MSTNSSELTSRLLIALVGIPILLYLIIWGPRWGFAGLVAGAAAVAVWEYCTITYGEEHLSGKIVTAVLTFAVAGTAYLHASFLLEAVLLATIVVSTYFLFTFADRERVSHQVASSVIALLYGGAFLGVLIILHGRAHGPAWIILTLVTVWMSDTGAYFTGRVVGNHPLYESVSPNKSIEGSIGGFVGSLFGAFVCNWLFLRTGDWTTLSIGAVLVLAIPGNLLAQTGDLVESVVKRAHEVDDSGSILGGHGGLLDRIDGLIYAAPWFYICVVWILPLLR